MERITTYPPEYVTKHGAQRVFDKIIIPDVLEVDLSVASEVSVTDPPNLIKVVSDGTPGVLIVTITEPIILNIIKDESIAVFTLSVKDGAAGVSLAEMRTGVTAATLALSPSVVVTAPPKTAGDLAYEREVKRIVIDSVSGRAIGQDSRYEDLKYKHIIEPYVNDPDAERGYVDINDNTTPVPSGIARITIRKPTDTTTPDQWTMAVDADAEEFAFNVPESGRAYSIDCVAGTTLSELIDLLEADAGFVSMFFININEGFDGTEIVGTREATNFKGGKAGHVMLATGEQIDNAVVQAAKAPTIYNYESDAPFIATEATYTHDTDKLTLTSASRGSSQNDISINITCQLSMSLGANTAEMILTACPGIYPGTLISARIDQGVGESIPFSVDYTNGKIIVTLPTKEDGEPYPVSMIDVFDAIEDAISEDLDGILEGVAPGALFDQNERAAEVAEVPFRCAETTLFENGTDITVYMAYDGNFPDWDELVTPINNLQTQVIASLGAESEAVPFTRPENLTGGVDSLLCVAGQIIYDPDNGKLMFCLEDTAVDESDLTKYALFTKDE